MSSQVKEQGGAQMASRSFLPCPLVCALDDAIHRGMSAGRVMTFRTNCIRFLDNLLRRQYLTMQKSGEAGVYVPLDSRILRKVVCHRYKRVVNFLLQYELVESNTLELNRRAEITRCYRINPAKLGAQYQDVECGVQRSPEALPEALKRQVEGLQSISIDVTSAQRALEQHYSALRPVKGWTEVEASTRVALAMMPVYELHRGAIRISKDDTVRRIHSTFSALPKVARQHVRLRGFPLVEVDVGASVPFIMAGLALNILKGESTSLRDKIVGVMSEEGILPSRETSKHQHSHKVVRIQCDSTIGGALSDRISKTLVLDYSHPTQRSSKEFLLSDVARFLKDCVCGDLYSVIERKAVESGGRLSAQADPKQRRAEVKTLVLKGINSVRDNEVLALIREQYPLLGLVLDNMRRYYVDSGVPRNKKKLALSWLVLRVESRIVLGAIDRLQQRVCNGVFISLHDAVFTSSEHCKLVADVLGESFVEFFGVRPRIETSEQTSSPTSGVEKMAC